MTPKDRLARLIGASTSTASESAWTHVPAEALDLTVDGVGPIALPVDPADVRQLISVARPAQFGRGEETLHDASVRDTWEIAPDQVSLGGGLWQASLDTALAHLGGELGIPDPTRLRAELHALLVYGEGQFFAPHQDSEKHDDMVATLVVTLPSNHIGGRLVVHGRGGEKEYPGSPQDLTLVAFYADSRHEVLPVESGHRVSMTFNLLLDEQEEPAPAGSVDEAATLLRSHFSTPVKRPYGDRSVVPARLAFLLDHEYSQRGLEQGRLKGEDASRVALLAQAARLAGCESALAQTEIQETRDVQGGGDYGGYGGYGDDDDEDRRADGAGDESDASSLGDLLDNSATLRWWNDPESSGPIDLALADEEVCAVIPTVALAPYASEYEGYMGNYGNTSDRWYRRAALVIWPAEQGFSTRAEASPAWALQTILSSLAAGEPQQAREDVQGLLRVWGGAPQESLLAPALEIAAGVEDPDLAEEVLAPFAVEMLGPEHAAALGMLARAYPLSWWGSVAGRWGRGRASGNPDRQVWVRTTLVPLCRELEAVGAQDVVDWLIPWMSGWLLDNVTAQVRTESVVRREEALERLGPVLAAVIEVGDDQQGVELGEQVCVLGDVVLPLLVATVRAHEPPANAATSVIARHARDSLEGLLAQPIRADGDVSIAWASPGGEDADRLGAFLASGTQRTLEWPLAEPRRRTIHFLISTADLPVSHVTRRTGRPYTLVLKKKVAELVAREATARSRAEADLAYLQKVLKDG